jgi:hypothetical protein
MTQLHHPIKKPATSTLHFFNFHFTFHLLSLCISSTSTLHFIYFHFAFFSTFTLYFIYFHFAFQCYYWMNHSAKHIPLINKLSTDSGQKYSDASNWCLYIYFMKKLQFIQKNYQKVNSCSITILFSSNHWNNIHFVYLYNLNRLLVFSINLH